MINSTDFDDAIVVTSLMTPTMSLQEFDELCNLFPEYQLDDGSRIILTQAALDGNADLSRAHC